MKHLDLFSGIGGFALAARWAGFETIGFSEIDPYAIRVLAKNFPGVPNYGDVRNVPAIRCDIITGGFPCQPFSLAGKRAGANDDRFLWPAMRDVIARCRPAWIVGENVPGIIGMELDRVLVELEGIGYQSQVLVVPACAVDARHRRDRVWIVAHAQRSERRPGDEGGGCDCKRQDIQRQTASGIGQCREVLAHRQCPRLEIGQEQSAREKLSTAERSSCVVSNAADARTEALRGRRDAPVLSNTRRRDGEGEGTIERGGSESAGRFAQSPVRRVADGLPEGLDGPTRWPEEDPKVPRIATGIPNRANRLKGLGNAIVPQVAYEILKAIAAHET